MMLKLFVLLVIAILLIGIKYYCNRIKESALMDFFDNNRTPISRDTIPDGLRFVYSKEKKKVWFAKRVLLGNICVTEKLSLQRGFDLVQLLGTMPSH